jgi:hypothetical protein
MATPPILWNGNFAKFLKDQLNLNDTAYVLTGSDDPSAVAKNAPRGSLYIRNTGSGGELWQKQDNGSTTNWTNLGAGGGGGGANQVPQFTDEYFIDAVNGNDTTALTDPSKPFQTIQACLNMLGHPVSMQDQARKIKINIKGAHSAVEGTNSNGSTGFDGIYEENLWVPSRRVTFYGDGVKIGNRLLNTGYGHILQEVSEGRRFGIGSSEQRFTMEFAGSLTSRDSHNRLASGMHVAGSTRISALKRNIGSIQGDGSGPNDRVTITLAGGQNPYSIAVSPGAYKNVTMTDSTDTVNLNNHGFAANTQIFFRDIVSTTGISIDTRYYVVNPTTNDFQLSLTSGGAAIALTNDGTGVIMPWDWGIVPFETLIRIAVTGTTNYNVVYDIIEKVNDTTFIARRRTGTNTSTAIENAGAFIETTSAGTSAAVTTDLVCRNAYMQGIVSKDDGIVNGGQTSATSGTAPNAGTLAMYTFDCRYFSGIVGANISIIRAEKNVLAFTMPAGVISSYSRTGNVVTVSAANASYPTLSWGNGDTVTIANSASGGGQNINGTFQVTGGGLGTLTFTQVGADYGAQTPTSGSSSVAARSRISAIVSSSENSISGGVILATSTYGTDDLGWSNNKIAATARFQLTQTAALPFANLRMDGVTATSFMANGARWVMPVTFQDTGDTVTRTSHGLVAGTVVQFESITSTTGISTATNYYVVNPAANTFQLASTVGGAALALTTNGTGLMTVSFDNVSNQATMLDHDWGIKNNSRVTGNTVKEALDNISYSAGASGIFTQTNTVTVANIESETALTGTGQGSLTLPANFLAAGRSIKFDMRGFFSTSGNPTIRIQVKLGSTTVLDTGTVNTSNETNAGWKLDGLLSCRTVGTSGTVIAQGSWSHYGSTTGGQNMVNTATTTIDTTVTQAISITVIWGTASSLNTISATTFKAT